jgi:hypothetical protein
MTASTSALSGTGRWTRSKARFSWLGIDAPVEGEGYSGNREASLKVRIGKRTAVPQNMPILRLDVMPARRDAILS